jgi:hypothetical protein
MLLHPHQNGMIWELPGVADGGVGCPVGAIDRINRRARSF